MKCNLVHCRILTGHVALVMALIVSDMVVMPSRARCSSPSTDIDHGANCLLLRHGGTTLTVSTRCPTCVLSGRPYGGGDAIEEAREDLTSGGLATLTFVPMKLEGGGQLEVILHVQWSKSENILRKWARYRVTDAPQSVLLEEVVLDELDEVSGAVLSADQAIIQPPASYPVLLTNFFVGVEFPVASTRIDGARVILAHQPGLRLQSGTWYETRKAIFGVAAAGHEKESFRRYIQAHTPGGFRRMFVWETWISVPIRYTETDQAEVMKIIRDNLLARHNVTVDACVLTAGWSDPESIYQLDSARFPGGFDGIQAASIQNGLAPGFWISPSAYYGFALDTKWAKDQGYETISLNDNLRVACIGGTRYQSELKKRVVEMFGKHGMTYAYFDGYAPMCAETDHGHEPGALSAEALAANLIDVFEACRAVRPSVWLEATCFGGNASPWWLFHVNTVLGNYGDDCMFGRVPAPVYRDSQTTARDRANLQGCYYSPLPVAQQEVFAGLYCHTTEPIVNDAVMGVMRGNMLYLLCTNPRLISEYGWAALAEVIKWARTNTEAFAQTQALLPASWCFGKCPKFVYDGPTPREAYGYAHWTADEGIVAVRNPWMVPTDYTLELTGSTGLSPDTSGWCAISLYPENRTYATGLRYGDKIRVPLRPYETLVLWIRKPLADVDLPTVPGEFSRAIGSTPTRADVSRLMFDSGSPANSESRMCLMGDTASAIELDLESDITVDAPHGELLILLEDKEPIISPVCEVLVNGDKVPYTCSGPDTGYNADGHPCPEQWLFLRAPLLPGGNRVQVQLTTRTPSPRLSVWAWAKKNGTVHGSTYPNSLPQPEEISLDAVEIIPAIDGASESLKTAKAERPGMDINGVFIDALEPESVTGALVKNGNYAKKSLKVCGRNLLRGIGTNAPSRIAFATRGNYGRLQSWVGVDNGTSCADKTRVVFEVWADGEKLWNSDPMTRWDGPVFADVDIRGRDRIELVTLDQADKGADRANWVDWAEARVVK